MERIAGGAPDHPAAVQRAPVRSLIAAGPQQDRQQRRDRQALWHSGVDPEVRRLPGDPD
jgi:hypothetical protein